VTDEEWNNWHSSMDAATDHSKHPTYPITAMLHPSTTAEKVSEDYGTL
jgi:hypothetical protein